MEIEKIFKNLILADFIVIILMVISSMYQPSEISNLYENLNDNVKKFVPKLVGKFNVNAFWHFPIIVDDKDFVKFQKHLLKDGFDVVGYAMKLCNGIMKSNYAMKLRSDIMR